ncbi:DUF6436 domain-containing protein [Thalassotalea sediminis]|uniref:DUF6436 domain-containing protein n=1 Tax=Thalassotalea sediminis TaxID=1759089 RepID=UPI002573D682|nr:DUF6436 domain-containing protein [Thalassotalea sediminis]
MKNKPQLLLLGVTIIWFVTVLAILVYVAKRDLSPFDPDNSLVIAASSPAFDRVFTQRLQQEIGDTDNTIVHFKRSHCDCNRVAEQHIDSVIELAQKQHYKNRYVSLTADLSNKLRLASAPAVALFNKEGNLVYLGPYAAGYSCSAGNGIIESFINRNNEAILGATIVSDADGCYCSHS